MSATTLEVERRRKHYTDRLTRAATSREKVNAACDYVRAALARAPVERVELAVRDLISIAEEGTRP